MTEANLHIIKIEAHHCYKCGRPFGELKTHPERKKTMHHAIPQFLKPQRNVEVPICEECHREINKYSVQSVPKLQALDNFIKSMEQIIKKYKEMVKNYSLEEKQDD